MNNNFKCVVAVLLFAGLTASAAGAQETKKEIKSVKENTSQVQKLNAFVDDLLRVHQYRLKTQKINQTERIGSYQGMPDHYRDVEYHDAATGLLLSRIRWENKTSGLPEMIEVYFYDKQGRVSVDYLAVFLPGHRNAPFQAVVNIHTHDDSLSAFRQFDFYEDRLYERCEGDFFGQKVDLRLDDIDIPPEPEDVSPELYTACFGLLPTTVGNYLKPADLIPALKEAALMGEETGMTHDTLARRIAELDRKITAEPDNAGLYAKRGRDHLTLFNFSEAIFDFTTAIELNDDLDAAYFGRGMAHGRIGEIDKGIADLSVFIRRNPESSLAYTKRGVRRIWKKDFKGARKDLLMATSLDDTNAEAHDDLGVALAQLGEIQEALNHLLKAKALEPGYQKVHHNLAMVYFIAGDHERALSAANDSLRLQPQNRSSMFLKGNILGKMGRTAEAEEVKANAAFLSEGNWSEQSAIR
ncbi:MAG: tetratricopeptide repeat protein [Proteobacteria bacterium]|nr:tetratricopeptide repeat protein [Pseudomonadota bacterium]